MNNSKWKVDEHGTIYLDANCEICGNQAQVGVCDEIDVTEIGDKCRRFVPGEMHYYCLEHEPK